MRVLVCFKEGSAKRTKVVENVKTQYDAEQDIKRSSPDASILYTSIVINATEGSMSSINMLSVM